MIRALLTFTLTLTVLIGGSSAAQALTYPERRLVVFTNEARVAHGLPPLRGGWRLTRFADQVAARLAREGRLAHATSGPCWYWGENIGVTGGTMRSLHQAFMESSAHRANVLNGQFRRIGVSVVKRDGLRWVALEFCR